MYEPSSTIKLRSAFKADWPDWDIDEDSFSRWADVDIDCPLLVTMMKGYEADLIKEGKIKTHTEEEFFTILEESVEI